MAAADVEQSFESLSCQSEINETLISSIKDGQTTAFKAFVDKTRVCCDSDWICYHTFLYSDGVACPSSVIHVSVSTR